MEEGADTHLQQPDIGKALFRGAVFVVLLLLGCAAIGTVVANLSGATLAGLVVVVKFGAMIAAALAIGYLQFRHWAPALGVSLAPVPAIGLSLVLSAPQPTPFHLLAVFSYLLGFAVGLTIADSFVATIADGTMMPGRVIRRSDVPIAVSSLVAAAIPLLVLGLTGRAGEHVVVLPAMWSNAAAVFLAVAVVPLACSFGTYGEDFIASSNRIGDDWNRWLDLVAGVAQPRWSSSAVGILVVFVVLAVFGSAPLHVAMTSRLTHFGVAAVGLSIVAALAAAVARSWRRALALAIVMLCGFAIMVWGFARANAALDVRLATIALDLSALAYVPLAIWTAHAAQRASDTGLASARAMSEKGPIALLSIGSSLVLLIPWYVECDGARLGTAFELLFATVAVTVLLPAAANMIDMIAPSSQAVASRYRIK